MSMSEAFTERAEREAERQAGCRRGESLEAMLLECLEYFEDRADIKDGFNGEPVPNIEMNLASEIKSILGPMSLAAPATRRDGADATNASETSAHD